MKSDDLALWGYRAIHPSLSSVGNRINNKLGNEILSKRQSALSQIS